MRTIINIGTFLILSFCSTAQSNPETLWQIWQNPDLPDTSRFEAFDKLINEHYLSTHPDSALYHAQSLLDAAEQAGAKRYVIRALKIQGRAASYSDLTQSREYLLRALSVCYEIEDLHLQSEVLNNIGITHYYQGERAAAFKYWSEALRVGMQCGNTRIERIVNTEMGNLYKDIGDFQSATAYYESALSAALEEDDQSVVAVVTENLAHTYADLGDTTKALEFYQRALRLNQDANRPMGEARVQVGLARIYFGRDNDRFHQHLAHVERLSNQMNWTEGIDYVAQLKGRIALHNGRYVDAIRECKLHLDLAVEHQMLRAEIDACECLYQAHKALNQGSQALIYHERLLSLNVKQESQETDKKLQGMEFRKQVLADSLKQEEEKLRLEMAYQEQVSKEKSRRNTFMFGGIGVLLLAGGLWSRLRYIRKSKAVLQVEKDRSENLLLNILPAEIAEELKATGKAAARDFEMVSIIFTDFKSFTETSEKLSASELVAELNYCFEGFDAIMEKHGVEKIKTIGDAYMAAGGLPVSTDDSTRDTVKAALEMQEFIAKRKATQDAQGLPAFEMRAGVHTGPVVAGIVGVKKFQYDIWGDTVNTAARMESAGEVGQVNVSRDTYEQIKDDTSFSFENRGKVEVKGKGEMEMYFVA